MVSSSAASSTFRIDWRPSRWLVSALLVLGALAGVCLLMSDLRTEAKLPAVALALLHAIRLARREAARPTERWAWPGGTAPARLVRASGELVLTNVRVQLRGPLAALTGTDSLGRRRHRVWWPDTLPSPARRQLRLASGVICRSETAPPPVAA